MKRVLREGGGQKNAFWDLPFDFGLLLSKREVSSHFLFGLVCFAFLLCQNNKKWKDKRRAGQKNLFFFQGLGAFRGTGLAEEQANNQPNKKTSFPSLYFLLSLSLSLSLYIYITFSSLSISFCPSFFFIYLLLLPCFLLLVLFFFSFLAFFCCFDSTEVGQSKKRKQGRKEKRREKRERKTNQKRDKREKKDKNRKGPKEQQMSKQNKKGRS